MRKEREGGRGRGGGMVVREKRRTERSKERSRE